MGVISAAVFAVALTCLPSWLQTPPSVIAPVYEHATCICRCEAAKFSNEVVCEGYLLYFVGGVAVGAWSAALGIGLVAYCCRARVEPRGDQVVLRGAVPPSVWRREPTSTWRQWPTLQ